MSVLVAVLLAQVGPHFGKSDEWRPFDPKQRLAAAYYFVHWDAESGAGMSDPDGTEALQDHPPSLKDFSYRKPARHRTELADMKAAKVDIVLPLYQGDAAPIRALAEAIVDIDNAPRVAALIDLAKCKDVFAAARDIFSLIPPKYWALIDGRPLVWLSPTDKPPSLDAIRDGFNAALGVAPFVVGDFKEADARYAWGAARTGPRELDVVSVGPGYNDTTVPGSEPTVLDRVKGAVYEMAWYVALRIQPRIVAIETWNNFRDATEVCESREHGRAYIDITAKAVEKLRKGEGMMLPKGRWTGADRVLWNLKTPPLERGLVLVKSLDGLFEKVDLAGMDVVTTKANELGKTRSLRFAIDDAWSYWEKKSMEVTVEYFDQGKGSFKIEYDSADKTLNVQERAYKAGGEEFFSDTRDWKTARFDLPDALFADRQAGNTDFRLIVDGRGLMIRRVIVRPNR